MKLSGYEIENGLKKYFNTAKTLNNSTAQNLSIKEGQSSYLIIAAQASEISSTAPAAPAPAKANQKDQTKKTVKSKEVSSAAKAKIDHKAMTSQSKAASPFLVNGA